MKKIFIAVIAFVGMSSFGFCQSSEGNLVMVDESTNSLLVQESSGKVVKLVRENNAVAIIPGELIIIKLNGIAVNRKNEVVGRSIESITIEDLVIDER